MSINFMAGITVDVTEFLEAFVSSLVEWGGGQEERETEAADHSMA